MDEKQIQEEARRLKAVRSERAKFSALKSAIVRAVKSGDPEKIEAARAAYAAVDGEARATSALAWALTRAKYQVGPFARKGEPS